MIIPMDDGDSAEIASLLESGLFDPQWYAATYPDVRMSGLSPGEHFLRIGRRIGRPGTDQALQRQRSGSAAPLPESGSAASRSQLPNAVGRAPLPVITAQIREAVARTKLFDERWYLSQYGPRTRHPEDLLIDYLSSFTADPTRDPGPLFSTAYYAATHQDIGGLHPFLHLVLHGLREGRHAFPAHKINSFFDGVDPSQVPEFRDVAAADRLTVVLTWDKGNFFFTEIAEYTARYLQSLGMRAESRTDVSAAELEKSNVIIVAPHEFCVYGPGRDWSPRHLQRATYLNTEQWHTSWFALAFGFVIQSGKVIDINPASAAALATLGFEASFMPLLPLAGSCFSHPDQPLSESLTRHKAMKSLHYPEAVHERPYDVMFVGVANQRRAKALAGLAPVLQRYECFVHAPEFATPVRAGDPDMIGNADLAQIARNSKILLNIHQGETHYFEWHRLVVSGIMEGCIVVTEKCHPTGVFQPGEHYLETTLEDMGALIAHLLDTEHGRATLARVHENCRKARNKIMESGTLS